MDSSSHTPEAHRTSEVPPVPRTPLPGLFVSHGSPMFAVRPSKAGPLLTELGRRLPPLLAVLPAEHAASNPTNPIEKRIFAIFCMII